MNDSDQDDPLFDAVPEEHDQFATLPNLEPAAPVTLPAPQLDSSPQQNTQQVEFIIMVPDHTTSKLSLKMSLTETILAVKTRIQADHIQKPDPSIQKILYKGRVLDDDQLLRDLVDPSKLVIGSELGEAKFHLILNTDHRRVEPEERKAAPVIEAPQQQPEPRQPPKTPLTKDEILVSRAFLKYEARLLKEYQKSVQHLEHPQTQVPSSFDSLTMAPQSVGHYQSQRVDTNMGPDQHFLLTRLPIMEYAFQQRTGIYAAAQNIKANVTDLTGNNAIRFLGYDTILQPTLFMKLFAFMLIFGMNAPGNLKWCVVCLLVIYYFHHVMSLYVSHFEQQRRLLNLNQNQNQNQPVPVAAAQPQPQVQAQPNNGEFGDFRNEGLGQPRQAAAEQVQQPEEAGMVLGCMFMVFNWIKLVVMLVYYFFLSLHHDLIDPVITEFDQQRARHLQAEQAAQRRRTEEAARVEANNQNQQAENADNQANLPVPAGPQMIAQEIHARPVEQLQPEPEREGVRQRRVEVQPEEVKQGDAEEDEGDVLFDLKDDLAEYA